jgi:hypothetical protein
MDSYQALYYPYIHFKDDRWLKLAALYWDKVARIVPDSYVTDDSDTVKALAPCIMTIAPYWTPNDFARVFVEFINRYAPQLQAQYALILKHGWPLVPKQDQPPQAGGPSGSDPRLSYIYYEKLDEGVYAALCSSGLAAPDAPYAPWVGMHPRLASVYMTAMAEQIAAHNGLRPLTDEARDHVALSSLSTERLAQVLLGDVKLVDSQATSTEIESTLVSVAFQAIVPANLSDLDPERILEFRERYPEERAAFQTAAADLLGRRDWLSMIEDPRRLEQRLHDEYEKEWDLKLRNLREKLKDVGIDAALGCFNVKAVLPAGISGALAGVALNSVSAGVAGFALGVVPMLRDKRKQALGALRESPVSYLYRMEQDLAPKDLRGWVTQGAQRFVLGI